MHSKYCWRYYCWHLPQQGFLLLKRLPLGQATALQIVVVAAAAATVAAAAVVAVGAALPQVPPLVWV
jgi:hypothetical protein